MLRDLPKDVDMNANLAAQGPLLVVTDLMGTTLRDDGAVLPAYRTAFAECAIPFTEQELANCRGAHKLNLFTEFATRRYPADEAPKIAAAALTVFESKLRRLLASGGGMPISGAEDAIRQLRTAGIKVALTSGFDRGLIADIVAHCGWAELFETDARPVHSTERRSGVGPQLAAGDQVLEARRDLRIFGVEHIKDLTQFPLSSVDLVNHISYRDRAHENGEVIRPPLRHPVPPTL